MTERSTSSSRTRPSERAAGGSGRPPHPTGHHLGERIRQHGTRPDGNPKGEAPTIGAANPRDRGERRFSSLSVWLDPRPIDEEVGIVALDDVDLGGPSEKIGKDDEVSFGEPGARRDEQCLREHGSGSGSPRQRVGLRVIDRVAEVLKAETGDATFGATGRTARDDHDAQRHTKPADALIA